MGQSCASITKMLQSGLDVFLRSGQREMNQESPNASVMWKAGLGCQDVFFLA